MKFQRMLILKMGSKNDKRDWINVTYDRNKRRALTKKVIKFLIV